MTADGPPPSDEPGADGDAASSGPVDGGRLLESAVVVASVLLVAGVFGYLLSQALVAPAAPDPTATVDAVEQSPSDGSVRVTVALDNEGETGLRSVEVVVRCGGTERSLTFTHVPARGHRTGTVVCPEGTAPSASVATYIEA